MRALRLLLAQTSANYRKEESVTNKMTLPLPPLSTIIGAIHSACGYTELKKMDISIQGKYGAMHREPYTDYCFLNSTMDDRGILVKMKNADLYSKAYDLVATAKKSMGNSFRNEVTIQVHNRKLLDEYQRIKDIGDEIKTFKSGKLADVFALIKKRKSSITKKKKLCVKGSEKFKMLDNREKEIKELEKEIKSQVKVYEREHYSKPVSQFRSLTTSMRFYEILDDVTLVLHIRAEEQVLLDIMEHVNELTSIGRSEDFINVLDAQFVDLSQEVGAEFKNPYAAYIGLKEVRQDRIYTKQNDALGKVAGTKYYLNKYYDSEAAKTGKRIFVDRVPVIYMSEHYIGEVSEDLYVDLVNGERCIVNFL